MGNFNEDLNRRRGINLNYPGPEMVGVIYRRADPMDGVEAYMTLRLLAKRGGLKMPNPSVLVPTAELLKWIHPNTLTTEQITHVVRCWKWVNACLHMGSVVVDRTTAEFNRTMTNALSASPLKDLKLETYLTD